MVHIKEIYKEAYFINKISWVIYNLSKVGVVIGAGNGGGVTN